MQRGRGFAKVVGRERSDGFRFKSDHVVFQMVFHGKYEPEFFLLKQILIEPIQITPAHQIQSETRLNRGFQTRFDGNGFHTVQL